MTTACATTTKTDADVLIVGAGPTGLTLGCELARLGIRFRIIEASPVPQRGSRGKGIQPRTLEVFDDLGIVDRVIAHGRFAMPTWSTNANGETTRRGGQIPEPKPDVPYGASLVTPEWRIEEALRDRLVTLGSEVEFDTRLVGFEQSQDVVSATIAVGDKQTGLSARWLIGCDGGHSLVRKQAGIDFAGETLEDIRMIVADVAADGIGRDAWHMWSHEEGMVALCPLPSTDEFQLQASIGPGQNPELSLANMQAILERRAARTDIRLHTPSWSSLWRANVRMVNRYRVGQVLVAGDAAHIHSPAGGQGMNTGIQDAHNLGWKLAAVLKGAAPTLIDTYQEERLPVAADVLGLSNELMRKVIATQSFGAARNDTRALQLDVGYRASCLSRDDRSDAAGLRAGDRAPDATGLATRAGSCRLFDHLRGGHFTLLAFGHSPDLSNIHVGFPWLEVRTLRIAGELVGPNDLIDGEGHLADAYRPQDGSLVLVRPDGYVGLIAAEGGRSAVEEYLMHALGADKV